MKQNIEILDLKLSLDGNQYCILMGNNLQEGVAGFGKTREEAFKKFLKALDNVECLMCPDLSGKS